MGAENGSTTRWRTARERNRLKARYLIQSRVLSRVNDDNGSDSRGNEVSSPTVASVTDRSSISCSNVDSSSSVSSTAPNADDSMNLSLEEMNIIMTYLRAIVANDISAFSVAAMARHGHLLNGPLPTAAVFAILEETLDLDLSVGTSGASLMEDASYEFSMMLSTEFPWERNQQLNGDVTNNTRSTTDDAAQLSRSTTLLDSDESLPPPRPQLQPQPTTLATSKYGPQYVTQRLVPYMQHLHVRGHRQLTVVEYASLLGRHGILQQMLLGGLDTTVGNRNNGEKGGNNESDTRAELASRRVLALFHSVENREEISTIGVDGASCKIPLSMWSYITRAVIEMRMNGVLDADKNEKMDPRLGSAVCNLCNHEAHLLHFGPPCHHTYCETCMWNYLVDQVPLCTNLRRNVITCPICDEEFGGFQYCEQDQNSSRQKINAATKTADRPEEKKDDEETLSTNDLHNMQQEDSKSSIELREQRRLESFNKYMALPPNSVALKSSKRNKRKKERDSAHGTWEEALRPFIQTHQSREVRSDRFFKAVLSSSHLVAGYLDSGIDVNTQNFYGQTPLYVACWKGSLVVVQQLLDYGANFGIAANGGSTCYSVAMKYRRKDVLHLLESYSRANHAKTTWATSRRLGDPSDNDYQVSILIEPMADHPGAGACIVDNALSEAQLQKLETLWRSLPVADVGDEVDGESSLNRNAKSSKKGMTLEGKQAVVHIKSTSFISEKSSYRPTRSYFCDAEEEIQTALEGCVHAARMALALSADSVLTLSASPNNNDGPPTSVFKQLRFLNYDEPGGVLPPHVDLCRVDEVSGVRSTHTFILYLTDCEQGGGTALLKKLKDPKVLAVAQPKRGRALMFRHECPHSGLEVDCAPKLLLRGEVILDLP